MIDIKKTLLLLISTITLFSCSKDSPPNVADTNIDPNSENLFSIRYPYSQDLPYNRDPYKFEYDNSKRIVKYSISNSSTPYTIGITYVNPNLIETNLLEDGISNFDITAKSLYTLQNNKIQYAVTKTIRKNVGSQLIYDTTIDSTLFSYDNNNIVKVETYSIGRDSPDRPGYFLQYKIDYQLSNGNITKTIFTNGPYSSSRLNYTSNFTYDNQPYIPFGEFAYETPISNFVNYILLDKFTGNKTVNNIVKVVKSYPIGFLEKSFETINYTREVDQFGRLKNIFMSGNIINSGSNQNNSSFTNQKIEFIYK